MVGTDVLLLDIMMRGIDGYEVMQTVLAYPELADVNIAILTSLGRDELDQRGGLPSGVTYFSKPMAQDELRGYIRACIAQKARRVHGRWVRRRRQAIAGRVAAGSTVSLSSRRSNTIASLPIFSACLWSLKIKKTIPIRVSTSTRR